MSIPYSAILYGLAFCRLVIGLVFAWSFAGKVRDISSFTQAINRFQILPRPLVVSAAFAFLCAELVLALAMFIGGNMLPISFLLSATLLVAFCFALASILIRKIQTSCNCFGSSEKSVSIYDVARNIVLIACSLAGYSMSLSVGSSTAYLGWLDWSLVSIAASVFVIFWVNFGEMIDILVAIR